jgi:hypothetical protein
MVGFKMTKKFLRNRKGTAEVIGSVMFIVILLFFFTNVYLWHDSATKEMNEMYVKKMSSSFTILNYGANLTVKADGGSGITLSRLWIIDQSGGVTRHLYADLRNANVTAGDSFTIKFSTSTNPPNPTEYVSSSNVNGKTITVNYAPQTNVKYTIINDMGIIIAPTTS